MKSIEIQSLRAHLLRLARSVLNPADAEDLVQDVLKETVTKGESIKSVEGYARHVVKLRALDRKRTLAREVAVEETPESESDVASPCADALHEFASLAGALEHLAMWDDGHSTRLMLPSIAEVDVPAIRRDAAFYGCLVDSLPLSNRHQRRLFEKLAEDVRRVQTACGYVYRGRDVDKTEPDPAEEARCVTPAPQPEWQDLAINGASLATVVPVTKLEFTADNPAYKELLALRTVPPADSLLFFETNGPPVDFARRTERVMNRERQGRPGEPRLFVDTEGLLYLMRDGRLLACEASMLLPDRRLYPDPGRYTALVFPRGRALLVLGGVLWRGARLARYLAPTLNVEQALAAAVNAYRHAYGEDEET